MANTRRIADHLGPQHPEVSICTTVFNAERFVAQAIEGVLSQETSFPVELVIGDDCSTDRSAEIIADYAKRFPNVIRFRSNAKNIGLNANFMATMRECRGEYIALLDGDDYWLDPGKLQMQRDFLRDHPDCVLCGTATKMLREQTGKLAQSHSDLRIEKGDTLFFSTDEMYKLYPFWIPTHTVLFRAQFLDFPPWFKDVVYVDRALRLILSLHGSLAFINKTTGVYRIHGSNVSAAQDIAPAVARGYLHTYLNFFEYSGHRYRRDARFAINHSVYEERLRIRRSFRGLQKIKHLAGNTRLAFAHFRILEFTDIVRFPYHYLFVGDVVDMFRAGNRGVMHHPENAEALHD